MLSIIRGLPALQPDQHHQVQGKHHHQQVHESTTIIRGLPEELVLSNLTSIIRYKVSTITNKYMSQLP